MKVYNAQTKGIRGAPKGQEQTRGIQRGWGRDAGNSQSTALKSEVQEPPLVPSLNQQHLAKVSILKF